MMDSSAGGGQEVELNLAPIIDCFTVLITYLLVTASFITLSAMDVSISANSDSKEAPPPVTNDKPLFCTMDLTTTGEVIVNVSGGDLKNDYHVVLPAKEGTWDPQALADLLGKIKVRWDNLKELSLSAGTTVKYKDLVNLINETKKILPKVYISGA